MNGSKGRLKVMCGSNTFCSIFLKEVIFHIRINEVWKEQSGQRTGKQRHTCRGDSCFFLEGWAKMGLMALLICDVVIWINIE